MSSAEKHGKTKGKGKNKKTDGPKSKSSKGKEIPLNDEKFRGDGVHFKCKLLGISEVNGPRGDKMCIEAIKKLKQQIKQSGEHKQKVLMIITLKGIRILDEKSKALIYEHPINKVSFITHDPDDKKIFGYICSAACSTGHMMYAIKYDKVAGVITTTLYELFQVVFKLRQEAAQRRKAQTNASPQVSNGPRLPAPEEDNNIYEEPSAPTSSTEPAAAPASHAPDVHYKEPSAPTSSIEPSAAPASHAPDVHYKVPPTRPLPPKPFASTQQESTVVACETSAEHVPSSGGDKERTQEANGGIQQQSSDSTSGLIFGFTSEPFFGSSVFTQGETPSGDTVSISSLDMIRKGSMSSSSSETASADTRSVDSKTGGVINMTESLSTPSPLLHNESLTFQPAFKSPVFQASFPEEPDYETIPSDDYETIPNVQETCSKGLNYSNNAMPANEFQSAVDFDSAFGSTPGVPSETEKRTGSIGVSGIEEKGSNSEEVVDPFASAKEASHGEDDPSMVALFDKNDLFASFGDSNFDTEGTTSTSNAFPVDDPFAPSAGTVSSELSNEEGAFASVDQFETAFGSAQFSPVRFNPSPPPEQSQGSTENTRTKASKETELQTKMDFSWTSAFGEDTEENCSAGVESVNQESGAALSWNDAFGSSEISDDSKLKLPESSQEKQETNKTTTKPTKQNPEQSQGSTENTRTKASKETELQTKMDFSWTSAFGEDTEENSSAGVESVKQESGAALSWNDAFGSSETSDDSKLKLSESSQEKQETNKSEAKVEFPWSADFADDGDIEINKESKPSEVDTQNKSTELASETQKIAGCDAFGGISESEKSGEGLDSSGLSNDVFASTPKEDTSATSDTDLFTLPSPGVSIQFSTELQFSNPTVPKPKLIQPTAETDDAAIKNNTDKVPVMDDPFGDFKVDFPSLKPAVVQPKESEDETTSNYIDILGDQVNLDKKTKLKCAEKALDKLDSVGNNTSAETSSEHCKELSDMLASESKETPKPTTLGIQPAMPSTERPLSPTAPPPLPPRPVAVPPSLPPRPRTYSTPVMSVTPPTPPVDPSGSPSLARAEVISPNLSGSAKKPPPALPPRIDLEARKSKCSAKAPQLHPLPANTASLGSDSFGPNTVTSTSSSPWPSNSLTSIKNINGTSASSKPTTSPDPFCDDFFTDFNFPSQGDYENINTGKYQVKQELFSDPFASKDGADVFSANFGDDVFANFGSANKAKSDDSFRHGIKYSFSGLPIEDPFSDVSDPFAGKVVLSDPFEGIPEKGKSKDNAFNLNEDPFGGDFSDSFA